MSTEAGIAVVRRNTEEVQGRGNFEVFEELFAADFVDHTSQPGGFTPDRDGARNSYRALRAAFPDFHAEIHWHISPGGIGEPEVPCTAPAIANAVFAAAGKRIRKLSIRVTEAV
jgi:hypothetical protein